MSARPEAHRPSRRRAVRRARWLRGPSRLLALMLSALLAPLAAGQALPPPAHALPAGGKVVVGSGAIRSSGAQMTIDQATARLGIDWQRFDIGSAASVEFRQPSASAIALNRVIGNDASAIYGKLSANGQVFLTNPNGVLFAPGAKVDVGALVASTLDLSQSDFAAGLLRFKDVGSAAAVVNQGRLAAAPGGYIGLFGRQVDNDGEIAVRGGSVLLASGHAATLAISDSGLLSAVVDPGATGQVGNRGLIDAPGSTVTLTARSAQTLAGSLVNNTGIVKANAIVERNGEIWMTGDQVAHSGRLDASAPAGGDGGRIVLLADMARGETRVGGTIDASAARGRGGFVETSGARVNVVEGATITTQAPNGQAGRWLIDPYDFTIAASGGDITGAALSSALATTDVTIQTTNGGVNCINASCGSGNAAGNGDIFVGAPVTWTAHKLTLSAYRNVEVNAALTGGDMASLALEYGQSAVAAGNTSRYSIAAPVTLPSGTSFSTKLGSDGPTRTFNVVVDAAGLQGIDALSRTGNYAIGANIDLASIANFNPIGNETTASINAGNSFGGRFEGLGHTVSGLTSSGFAAAGLFATASGADIRNLTLAGGTVTGTGNAGALAAVTSGTTVSNVRSTVAVSSSSTASPVGGLIGQTTTGSISDSAVGSPGSPVAISGGNRSGGLVGNSISTPIGNSSAGVNLTGAAAFVGGLVGSTDAAVSGSSSTGSAQTSGSARLGGLVGDTTSTVTSSTSSVAVTATNSGSYVGGLIGSSSAAVSGSTASGAVTGGARVGGLVGSYTGASNIGNSSATGNVTTNVAGAAVGGLVGSAIGSGSLTAATASGDVSAVANSGSVGGLVGDFNLAGGWSSVTAQGSVGGGFYTGGLAGEYRSAAAITSGSYTGASVNGGTWVGGLFGSISSAAAVTGPAPNNPLTVSATVTSLANAGGFAGYTAGSLTNVSASGSVMSTGTGAASVGGLVGEANGAGGLTDVSASGNVTAATQTGSVGGLVGYGNAGGVLRGQASGAVGGGRYTGGLVGYFDAGAASIASSSAGGNVSGFGDAGGIVGYASGSGSLSASSAAGSVTSSATSTYSVGGIAGYFALGGGLASTTTAGNVTGGAQAGGAIGYYNTTAALTGVTTPGSVTTVSGTTWVGGVVGYVSQAPTLSGLSSSANVTATGSTGAGAAGGVVGRSSGAVSGSSASGNVSGPYAVGGLIGWAEGTGTLTNSSASGNVGSPTALGWIGGLVGRYSLSGSIGGTISATGTVSGGSSAGGIVGYYNSSAPIAGLTRGTASVSGQDWVGGLVGYSEASSISGVSSTANVTSTGTGYAAGGLFGRTGSAVSSSSATGSVTAAGDAGGLVGRAEGSGAFTDVNATGNVASSLNSAAVGGLIGRTSSGAITRGAASGTVSGGSLTGGLAGLYSVNASITSSEATGNVTGTGVVGGLVGYSAGTGGITDGTARGSVTGSAGSNNVGGLVGEYRMSGAITRGNAHGNVAGGSRTGGLTGYQYSSGGIANSHAYGNVTGSSYVGGLVGDFVYAGNITDSTAAGAVSGSTYAGGLVGSFYSAGSLTTTTAAGAVSGEYAGGLLGLWQYSGAITDSRATGNISGTGYAGGLVAYAYDNSGGVNNSSAGGNVVGVTYVGGLIGYSGYTSLSRGTATGSVRAVGDSTLSVGGLLGYVYGSGTSYSVADSTASGAVTVDAPYAYVGGLIGQASTIAISNGRASGSVTLLDSRNVGSSSRFAGGLVGYYVAGNTTGISGGSRASGAVSGGYYAGGLVGYYDGNASTAGISDSSASGNVSAVQYGGGLVGSLSDVGIRNSQATGNVSVSSSSGYAGGLVAEGRVSYDGASISGSSATGNVTGGGSGYAGGLVGYWQNQLYDTGTAGILDSRASGNVANTAYAGGLVGYYSGVYYGFPAVDLGIRNSQASGSVAGSRFVGGLVGEFEGYGGIRDSSATGSVTGTSGTSAHYMGGLAGHFVNRNTTAGAGVLTRSYATGDVALAAGVTMNTSTAVNAGGLVGQLDGTSAAAVTLGDAYASGKVTLSSTNGRLNAGGLVSQANTSIDNVYSTGAVSATGGTARVVGGLVAARSGNAVVATDSYWATDSSGQAASVIGTGRTLAQLQSAATFNGWDIASTAGSSAVWRIYEGFTTPLLRGFLTPLALTLANVSKTYDGTASLGGATVTSSGGPVQFPDRIRVGGSGASADAGAYALSASNLYSVHNGYDLNIAGNAQLTIAKKPLTLDGLVANKVYDATTVANLAGTGQPAGLVAGEDLLFQPAGDFGLAFASKSAGTAKTVNIAGSYTWVDGAKGKVANYTLPTGTTTSADIAKATLSAGTFAATDRAYDGTTTVAVTATPASLSGVLGSDNVGVDLSSVTSGTIANKNVGSGKAVTVVGAAITGPDAGNYSLAGVGSATVNITPRTVTVNGITASNRAYDRGTSVSINTSGASLSGVLSGDQVLPSLGSANGAVADKNVGDGKPVTLTGLALRGVDSSNYTPQQGSVSVNITRRPVTIYAQATTGTNRVYDGTADATVALYNDFTYNIGNLWAGDSVTLTNTGVAYANKNVAYTGGGAVTSKTITVSGLAISGTDASNYALQNTTATTSGTISPRPLPVSGITAVNRVYDGTRDVQVSVAGATVDTSVVVPGDNVSVVIPSSGTVTGQMANKNVGNAKAVTVPGLTITGNDAGNYTVNSASNGVTVNITRKDLHVNYTANDKVYDGGTTVVTNATSTDIVGGDDINFYSNYYRQVIYGYNPWASFDNKNVGTGKTVSSNNESIYGNDAGNYTLIQPNGAIATASISVKPVTLAFNGVTKVYDGSTAATVTLNRSASGVAGGDSVSTTQTAQYTGAGAKNVGTGKPIGVSGIVFSGTDAGNYAVANTTATTTGTVTVKPVTLSGIDAVDRAYDGTTSVQVNATTVTSAGFVANDVVSVAQPLGGLTSGTIANKNVGTAKPVTVTGLSLTGADAGNYSIDLAGSGITVDIGRKALTPTYTGINRVYDGGVGVGVTPTTTGIEAGDSVTFSQQAAFTGSGARNVGTAKPVSVTSITLGGSSAGNYALTSTTATTTADVTPKPVTADYTGLSRVYNGLADTSISVLGSSLQVLAGDLVDFTQTATLTGDGSAGVNRAVAVGNIALTGQDAANYALVNTTATTTATITPRPLGVTGITAANRVYDGTSTVAVNVAGAAVDTSTKIAGDDVSVTLPLSGISTGTMADRHVGNAKPVSITGLTISGAQASNYSLIGASGLSVNITPAPLVAAYLAADKVYNGNANAVVTGTSSDIFAADTGGVTINATGTFTGAGAKDVGTGKSVAVRDGFLGGTFRDNYALVNPTGSSTASITRRSVTANYASGLAKVYDGGVGAPASGTVGNAIAGDAVGLTQSAEFTGPGARNVGNGKPIGITGIALTGADAGNYTLGTTTATTVGNITPKDITVFGLSNVTATDRVYNATRTVQVTVPTGVTLVASSSDIIAGDQVTIDVPSTGVTSGTMADKNVGSGKAVVVDGLSLGGADGGNYRIAGTAGITVNIAPKSLTATYAGVNRVYDGGVAATATGSSADIIGGDVVSISGSGIFTGSGAKNVGTAKPISLTRVDLGGADRGNYVLVNPTGSTSANITRRSLSVGYTGGTKVYDRTTAAPVSANFTGLISGDAVGVVQTAAFDNFNVAFNGSGQVTTKPIAVSGIALSGVDASNYALVNTTAATSGMITPRPITIDGLSGITATNRVYDGTTSVVVTISGTGTPTAHPGDIIAPDNVTVNVPGLGATTGTMIDRHVGIGKAVAITGLGLTGADSANYTIASGGAVTVDIAPKPITAAYTGVNKVYDGLASATVGATSGDILGIDVGTAIAAVGSFSGDGAKNAGIAKPIAVGGGTITGAFAGNYTLSNPTGTASADITPRPLSATFTGVDRVYDQTTQATVSVSLANLITGDSVSTSQIAAFADKNVAYDLGGQVTAKPVTIGSIALTGADAANYSIGSTNATASATISPKPLTLLGLSGITATNRTYDGTLSVDVTIAGNGALHPTTSDVIAGDVVTIVAPGGGSTTGTMADKNVGTAKPVVVAGFGLDGADKGNYRIAGIDGVAVDITPKPLTAAYAGVSKVYDGTPAASVTATSGDVVTGDSVSITASGVFTGAGAKNAGTAKPIAVGNGVLAGTDATNYALVNPTGAASADILQKPVTATYTGGSRVYDGDVAAPVNGSTADFVTGDAVGLTQTAVFSGFGAKNVGTGKPVSVTAITLTGEDAANYHLTSTSTLTTADVTPKPITIDGIAGALAIDRVYDGTRIVTVDVSGASAGTLTSSGFVAGDNVAISGGLMGQTTGTMIDKHVGSAKPVAIGGLTLTGADAPNYTIASVGGVTVNISPATLSVTGLLAIDREYDGSRAVTIDGTAASLSGRIGTDDVRLAAVGLSAQMADKNAGNAKPVSASGVALDGADAGNYRLASSDLHVNIAPRVLSFDAIAADREYDGTTAAAVSFRFGNRVAGDDLTLASSGAFFADKNAGNAKTVSIGGLALGGTDAANYALGATSLTASASIEPARVTVTASDQSKIYGDTLSLNGTEFSVDRLIGAERIGRVNLTSNGMGADKSAGSYPLVASNASGGTFDPANYVISYVDGKLTVDRRPLSIAANTVVAVAGQVPGSPYKVSANTGGLVAPDDIDKDSAITGFVDDSGAPVTAASVTSAAGGSVFRIRPSGVVFGQGLPSNYDVSYQDGLLIVLPKPPAIGETGASQTGSGDQVFVIRLSPEEVAAAMGALNNAAATNAASNDTQRTAGSPQRRPLVSTLSAAAPVPSGTEAPVPISVPGLLRLPLIALDPQMRRLILGSP